MADVLDQAPDPIVIGVDDDDDDTDLSGITLDMIKAVGPGDGCLNQAIYLRDTCLADSLPSVKVVYYENILTFIACIAYNALLKKQDNNSGAINVKMAELFNASIVSIPSNKTSFGGDYMYIKIYYKCIYLN